MNDSAPQAPCPTCKAPAEFSPANTYRPFCSERCQLIDLGEWFNEERSIPGEGAPDSSEQF